jgi:hypothetical protein
LSLVFDQLTGKRAEFVKPDHPKYEDHDPCNDLKDQIVIDITVFGTTVSGNCQTGDPKDIYDRYDHQTHRNIPQFMD